MALLTNSKINISAINVGQSIVRNASSLSIADVVSKIFSISSKIGRDALNAKCSYRERKDATIWSADAAVNFAMPVSPNGATLTLSVKITTCIFK